MNFTPVICTFANTHSHHMFTHTDIPWSPTHPLFLKVLWFACINIIRTNSTRHTGFLAINSCSGVSSSASARGLLATGGAMSSGGWWGRWEEGKAGCMPGGPPWRARGWGLGGPRAGRGRRPGPPAIIAGCGGWTSINHVIVT